MKLGVVVGRFQVDDIHKGHKALLSYANSRCDQLLIFIGVADQKYTDCDPLPFAERRHMLHEHFPQSIIMPILDHPDDRVWSANLDLVISSYEADSVIYAGSNEFKAHYTGTTSVVTVNCGTFGTSGTLRRAEIKNMNPSGSIEFRRGMIFATQNQFPRVIPCVDILPFALQDPSKPLKGDESRCEYLSEPHVIVGRKSHDGDYVRLIGGHVDPGENLDDAAVRELHEEVAGNLEALTLPIYSGSCVVDDWRHKKSKNNILSTVFVQEYLYTPRVHPKVVDGVGELIWANMIPIRSAEKQIHPIHANLFHLAQKKITAIFEERLQKYGK
jgi:bifunctional NMN adenylyltransferase/nudix hydrolase